MVRDGTIVALFSVSLVVNILVLIPLCTCIALNLEGIVDVFGSKTPARDILLAIYLAILLASVALLALVHVGRATVPARWMSVALLIVQVVYKLLSAVTVVGGTPPGFPINPVVLSNLGIAALHIVAIGVHLWASRNPTSSDSLAAALTNPASPGSLAMALGPGGGGGGGEEGRMG